MRDRDWYFISGCICLAGAIIAIGTAAAAILFDFVKGCP